jgi:hypothetical protein
LTPTFDYYPSCEKCRADNGLCTNPLVATEIADFLECGRSNIISVEVIISLWGFGGILVLTTNNPNLGNLGSTACYEYLGPTGGFAPFAFTTTQGPDYSFAQGCPVCQDQNSYVTMTFSGCCDSDTIGILVPPTVSLNDVIFTNNGCYVCIDNDPGNTGPNIVPSQIIYYTTTIGPGSCSTALCVGYPC